MIQRELDDCGRLINEARRGVHCEGDGVVVGMAAFIRVSEDGKGVVVAQQIGDAAGQPGEIARRLLVRQAQAPRAQMIGAAASPSGSRSWSRIPMTRHSA